MNTQNTCKQQAISFYDFIFRLVKKRITYCLLLVCISCQVFEEDTQESFDVFVIAGQSNTHMGIGFDVDKDQPDARIFQLGRSQPYNYWVIPAKEPLQHHTSQKNSIGFGLTFAKLYNKHANPNHNPILLIPCGYGGSSLQKDWTFDGELYTDMIERVQKTLEKYPGSQLKALLWHQGESDVGNSNYATLLDGFILQTRRDLKTNLPVIVGGMVPFWVAKTQARMHQQQIIKNTPNRIDHVGYADPEVPFVIEKTDNTFDEIHYDARGQRELGKRYFSAYENAISPKMDFSIFNKSNYPSKPND